MKIEDIEQVIESLECMGYEIVLRQNREHILEQLQGAIGDD